MHAYAIVSTSTLPATLPVGAMGELDVIAIASVAAVVEQALELAELQQNDQHLLHAVLAHDRVIRELFHHTTVLPLRFTSFPPLEHLQTDLQTHQQTYLEKLAFLSGKAEYTLKVRAIAQAEASPIAPNLKGKDYFLAKKQQVQTGHQQQLKQAEEMQRFVAAIAQYNPMFQTISASDHERTFFLLADIGAETQLYQTLAGWKSEYNQLDIRISEALPPYHFSSI